MQNGSIHRARHDDFVEHDGFASEPPGTKVLTAAVLMHGRTLRALRNFTKSPLDKDPTWRVPAQELLAGDEPPWADE